MNRTTQETVVNEPASPLYDAIDINGDLIPYADLPNYARRLVASRDEATREAKELRLALVELKAEAESEPTPEPWTLIPEGRENAAVLRVNGVVGTWFREGEFVLIRKTTASSSSVALGIGVVTSVEPVQVVPEGARVLGEGEAERLRELVERAKRNLRVAEPWGPIYDLIRDLAAVECGGGAVSAADPLYELRKIDDEAEANGGRIDEAWSEIASHPFFLPCYNSDSSLLEAMTQRLDEIRELVERARTIGRRIPDEGVTVDEAIRLIDDLAAVEGGGE